MTADDSVLKTVLTVFAALLAIPMLMMVVMMPIMMGGAMPMMGPAGAGTGSSVMMLLPAIVLLVLVGAGYVLYDRLGDGSGRETDDALEVLRIAYGRGELSDEEFENRRYKLQSTGGPDGVSKRD